MKAEQLRKSILQMAIQGKLVPQNPADEPASVLLEKIRVEKQKLIKAGKIKKDKNDSVIFKGEDNCYYEKVGNITNCINDEIADFEIPDSWSLCRFSVIANIYNGNSINEAEKQKKYAGLLSGYNYIGTKDVGFNHVINYNNGVKIPFDNKNFRIAYRSTPLLCIEGGSVGRKIGIITEDVCFGNKLCAFQSYGVNPYYLYYYLQNPIFLDVFKTKTTGIIGGVSVNVIKSLIFALPPLAEQERIVKRLEEYEPIIAQYDKLETEASELDNNIKEKLKKSILQYAIQGKLVPQDENNEHASVLLERIRAEKKVQLGKKYVDSYIYKGDDNCYYEKNGNATTCINDILPFEIPDSWQWIRLGNLFSHNTGKALNEKNTEGVLREYITTSNLYWGRFEIATLRKMYFTESEIDKCTVIKGDLLVCEGGDIGRSAIWNYDNKICIQNHIHRLRAYFQTETRLYYYVLFLYKNIGEIGGKGIGIQGLSANALHNLLLPLPPRYEQKRIREEIDYIFGFIEKDGR